MRNCNSFQLKICALIILHTSRIIILVDFCVLILEALFLTWQEITGLLLLVRILEVDC